jgi:O-antigen/teichoic acid export membrane protein
MCTSLGLPEIGARDVAAGADQRRIVGVVLIVRLGACLLLGLTVLAVAAAFWTSAVEWLAASLCMALGLSLSLDWVLRGRSAMGAVGAATATGGIVVLAGAAVIVPMRPSVVVALGIFALGEFTAALLTWRAARVRAFALANKRAAQITLRRSWPIALSSLLIYSYLANLDTVLLGVLRSAEDAGLYSGPYRLFLAVNVLGTFAGYALLPVVTRAAVGGDATRARAGLTARLDSLCGYGLALLAAAELFGGTILGAVFGSEFASMRSTLVVLCIALPWYAVTFPVGYTLIGFNQTKRYLAGAAVAATLNVLLALVLIPSFGTEGAAAATSISLALAGMVWLAVARVLNRRVGVMVLIMVAASGGGVAAAVSSSVTATIGALTLAAAAGCAVSNVRLGRAA